MVGRRQNFTCRRHRRVARSCFANHDKLLAHLPIAARIEESKPFLVHPRCQLKDNLRGALSKQEILRNLDLVRRDLRTNTLDCGKGRVRTRERGNSRPDGASFHARFRVQFLEGFREVSRHVGGTRFEPLCKYVCCWLHLIW